MGLFCISLDLSDLTPRMSIVSAEEKSPSSLFNQRPELFNYKSRLEKTPTQNLGLAFHLITKEFAVARLLEAEDLLSTDVVDARSVAMYLIELRSAVEMDRRRRIKPAFEIRTTAMVSS